MAKLFGKKVQPTCRYCAFGREVSGGSHVLCIKKGAVSPSYYCRKYSYDPLKRVPQTAPSLQTYTEEDFSLED